MPLYTFTVWPILTASFHRSLYASFHSSSAAASALSAAFLPPLFAAIMTTLVGRFVDPAAPSSARLGTNRYGRLWSSHSTGMWLMTSMGEMSAASTTMPGGGADDARLPGVAAGDLRIALTHSLTPRFSVLCLAATRGNLLAMKTRWGHLGGKPGKKDSYPS